MRCGSTTEEKSGQRDEPGVHQPIGLGDLIQAIGALSASDEEAAAIAVMLGLRLAEARQPFSVEQTGTTLPIAAYWCGGKFRTRRMVFDGLRHHGPVESALQMWLDSGQLAAKRASRLSANRLPPMSKDDGPDPKSATGIDPTVRHVAIVSEDDSDVLGLVAHGDMTSALRRLMQRHGTAIYRYCREELRDAALADDVQQQVFIEAFRDLRTFSRRSSLRTWLFAIAHHRVLDAAKARRRAQARVEDGDPTTVADPHPPAGELLDDRRLMEALLACLARLGPQVRTVLLLRFQQGLTFEELAEVCREKPGTLQAKVTRALPLLKECIEARTGGAL